MEDSSDVARLVVSESHPTLNLSAAQYFVSSLLAYVIYDNIARCADDIYHQEVSVDPPWNGP